jgi:hypothetical protein
MAPFVLPFVSEKARVHGLAPAPGTHPDFSGFSKRPSEDQSGL